MGIQQSQDKFLQMRQGCLPFVLFTCSSSLSTHLGSILTFAFTTQRTRLGCPQCVHVDLWGTRRVILSTEICGAGWGNFTRAPPPQWLNLLPPLRRLSLRRFIIAEVLLVFPKGLNQLYPLKKDGRDRHSQRALISTGPQSRHTLAGWLAWGLLRKVSFGLNGCEGGGTITHRRPAWPPNSFYPGSGCSPSLIHRLETGFA